MPRPLRVAPFAWPKPALARFIPAVGTYIGATIPIALLLAALGWQAALILLAWKVVYQTLENFALTPRISAQTMGSTAVSPNAAVLMGGALARPFGAFVSLPTAALIQSLISNYTRSYEVVYQSEFDGFEKSGSVQPGANDAEEAGT